VKDQSTPTSYAIVLHRDRRQPHKRLHPRRGHAKITAMIASLSLILVCQLAGEVIVRGIALPMPGPVLGLVLLLGLLLARDRFAVLLQGPLKDGGVENAARGLLAHLSLLFVPAGVGVVQKLDLIAAHGVAIVAVLAISVVITLLVTVATFLLASRLIARWRGVP
jgi:holin-like protein